jgi:hypothetical protein
MKGRTKIMKMVILLTGLLLIAVACSSAPPTQAIDPTQGARMLAGIYSTVISAEDLERFDTLDNNVQENLGHWSITLTDSGDFTANLDGGWIADGIYTVNGSSIEVYIESVCNECQCEENIGRYVWTLDGDQLSFRKIADSCDGMVLVMTSHPLSRQP